MTTELPEPPEVNRIMELAVNLCRSYEAMSIPTGELWRSITQDQFVQARQGMREAVADLLRAALAAQPAQAQPEEFLGLPFNEAKARILDMDAESARGLAISLMIQLGLRDKYAAQPAQPTTTAPADPFLAGISYPPDAPTRR